MTNNPAQTVYLADYKAPAYWVDHVDLTFKLAPNATCVISKVKFRPNTESYGDFFLHGENLKLIGAKINGTPVTPNVSKKGLTCAVPTTEFVWECEVEIDPAANTALEGLYMSNGMYCTQCEAEGFRKITFYPDRPDVMAPFDVRIEGHEPILLSNGNPGTSGTGFAEWHDPWPKPAYLFALVAGDLIAYPDSFTTKSGRDVELNIWVRDGDQDKCAFGMKALKASMKWDEDVYGREYDLDLFNIVAVDDFNMGAMENKGLNIFNSSAVLASPETATDGNFERIEAIIAHEYFHNWTGNRITCRDWFQLCLKEGLTVFRDQQFSADERSAPVQRINDVLALRGRQFSEDNGPLAHPPRPDHFVEINNFYTATVYEKGAEVIGMLKRLVGEENYDKALTMYFDRHDGQACTIEDWLQVFEDATGRDLSQFKRWYTDAGTPRLSVKETFEGDTLTLTFTQETPATPGQDNKPPRLIPISVGLLGQNGDEITPNTLLEMTQETQSFEFSGLASKPIPSILRDFSAPVILTRETNNVERAFLLAHDTDPFNKWEAGRSLAKDVLMNMITKGAAPDDLYLDAAMAVARDDDLDPAFRALTLAMPGQNDLAETLASGGHVPDPTAIWQALETLKQSLAQKGQDTFQRLYAANSVTGTYSPNAVSNGKRTLQGRALSFINRLDGGKTAQTQYDAADNMTLQLDALACLISAGKGDDAVAAFYNQWQSDRLVINKWFGLQITQADPSNAAVTTERLAKHADFTLTNPNRFRSVFGAMSANPAGFHDVSGAGYELLADWLIKLDPLNPQTTARMCSAFQSWRRYDENRQRLMKSAMDRIIKTEGLSADTSEMIGRILNG